MDFKHRLAEFLSYAGFVLPLAATVHLLLYGLYRRRTGLALLAVVAALILVFVYKPLFSALPELGIDSLRDGSNFDLREATFFLETFGYQTLAFKWVGYWVVFYLVAVAGLGFAGKRLALRYPARTRGLNLHYAVAGLIALPPMANVGYKAWQGISTASEELASLERNFAGHSGEFAVTAAPDNDLSVLLYIGESTSSMHWSLYGYPRDTTPRLRALERGGHLLRFDHVVSPHVHTSDSLIEALSVGANGTDRAAQPKTIYEKPRISVVDLLNQAGIQTAFFSNQSRGGTWNAASRIVFRNARLSRYSTDRALGNLDFMDDTRPLDHVYLPNALNYMGSAQGAGTRLVVFHSYAGHGDYKDFIPAAFRTPLDDFYRGVTPAAAFGRSSELASFEQAEGYDGAMRYLDSNLAGAFAAIDAIEKPIVALYFSDHGESPTSGVGHDSSRFVWEMGQVPLVLHFNPAARRQYGDLYRKYEALSQARRSASLTALPDLLFDLLGVGIVERSGDARAIRQCDFGSAACVPTYHVVRKRLDGTTSYVILPDAADPGSIAATNDSDRASITAFLARKRRRLDPGGQICLHRSNSLASILRARAVADCVEMDVTVEGQGIFVYHEPAPNVGLALDKSLAAIGRRPTTVWLDSKNIDTPANCAVLSEHLARTGNPHLRYFVEFPSESAANAVALQACMGKLAALGARLSFYVPTELGLQCLADRAQGAGGSRCRALRETLVRVARSGQFTDISFDFRLYPLIRLVPEVRAMGWNTWEIADADLLALPPGRFNLVIPIHGDDPNFN